MQARQDSISDYQQFKIEAEQKITAQEKNITDFKARIAKEKKEIKLIMIRSWLSWRIKTAI